MYYTEWYWCIILNGIVCFFLESCALCTILCGCTVCPGRGREHEWFPSDGCQSVARRSVREGGMVRGRGR